MFDDTPVTGLHLKLHTQDESERHFSTMHYIHTLLFRDLLISLQGNS